MLFSCSGTTGPYRRVYTNPGYSYLAARVYLPGGEDIRENDGELAEEEGCRQHTGDTGYVYVGGWGQHGGAVDAGFEHSPAHDNWSLFINCEGFGYTFDPQSRFAAGQEVWLEFSVPQDNLLTIKATGKDVDGQEVTRTVQVDAALYPRNNANVHADRAGQPTNFGWHANGAGVVLKRMTSIGQDVQTWQTGSFIKNVRWSEVVVGTSAAASEVWEGRHTGGYHNWRDAGLIVTRFVSPAEETVNILLEAPAAGKATAAA